MCGISGIITKNRIDIGAFREMTDIIRHRGPDDEGYVLFSNDNKYIVAGGNDTRNNFWSQKCSYQPTININDADGNYVIGFGHRRLAILDLSPAGHQPMADKNGRLWITFNGEIYNYVELRKELIDLNYQFYSETDTEVILAAYNEWGIECVNRFNGMWAFCIYDRLKEEIFLSRDRFGIKPLYYWVSPNGDFSFGSEIKQFTSLPGWIPKINPQRAYDYLIYSITDHTDETMFDGVFQIPGGHYFKSKISFIIQNISNKLCPIKWYEIEKNQFKGTFKEATSEFNKIFKSAIEMHLRSDVPLGSALSGGLDSTAIVCEINNNLSMKHCEHFQKTFSSCSADERYDERKWIEIVLGAIKVDAYFVYPRYEEIFSSISKLTWHHDEPYQSQSAFLGYKVFKLASQNGVKVLLNGQGADEYLGGYGQFTLIRYIDMFKKFD